VWNDSRHLCCHVATFRRLNVHVEVYRNQTCQLSHLKRVRVRPCVRVQNPRHPLADSKRACRFTFLVQKAIFPSNQKSKKSIDLLAGAEGVRCPLPPPPPPRLSASTFAHLQAAALRALPRPPRLCPGNDPLLEISHCWKVWGIGFWFSFPPIPEERNYTTC